jgi:phytoene desaturase
MGGTGALVKGWWLIEGQGGTVRCGRGEADPGAHGRAPGVTLATARSHPADVVVSNADSAWTYRHLLAPEHRKRWTDGAIERARYSMSLFVWYFGTAASTPTWRTTPSCSGRATGPARRHLRPQGPGRGLQPLPAPPHGDRPVAGARPAATRFYVLSPVPHLDAAASTGTCGRALPPRHRAAGSSDLLPGLADHIVTSRVITPQDFQDRLLVVPRRRLRAGAGADAERLVPPAQSQRGHRQPLPRRRRHPSGRRRAGRAVLGAHARHGGAR